MVNIDVDFDIYVPLMSQIYQCYNILETHGYIDKATVEFHNNIPKIKVFRNRGITNEK